MRGNQRHIYWMAWRNTACACGLSGSFRNSLLKTEASQQSLLAGQVGSYGVPMERVSDTTQDFNAILRASIAGRGGVDYRQCFALSLGQEGRSNGLIDKF